MAEESTHTELGYLAGKFKAIEHGPDICWKDADLKNGASNAALNFKSWFDERSSIPLTIEEQDAYRDAFIRGYQENHTGQEGYTDKLDKMPMVIDSIRRDYVKVAYNTDIIELALDMGTPVEEVKKAYMEAIAGLVFLHKNTKELLDILYPRLQNWS